MNESELWNDDEPVTRHGVDVPKTAPQTYKEYLQTMKAYRFRPMDKDLWEEWQEHWNKIYDRVPKEEES